MRPTTLNIAETLGTLKLLNRLKSWTNQTVVLCFHRINDDRDVFFPSLSPKVFDQLMRYVSKNFDVVHLNQLYSAPTKKPRLIITFDDGYKDFIENAVPILCHHKLPSTHAVVYDCVDKGVPIWTQRYFNIYQFLLTCNQNKITINSDIGNYTFFNTESEIMKVSKKLFGVLLRSPTTTRNKFIDDQYDKYNIEPHKEEMMGWTDVNQCKEADVKIAGHSKSHEVLSLPVSQEVLRAELVESKLKIEMKTGDELNILAFPNGLYNQEALSLAREHYEYLLGLDDQLMRKKKTVISRQSIYHESYLENKFKVEGFHNIIKSPYRLIKQLYVSI